MLKVMKFDVVEESRDTCAVAPLRALLLRLSVMRPPVITKLVTRVAARRGLLRPRSDGHYGSCVPRTVQHHNHKHHHLRLPTRQNSYFFLNSIIFRLFTTSTICRLPLLKDCRWFARASPPSSCATSQLGRPPQIPSTRLSKKHLRRLQPKPAWPAALPPPSEQTCRSRA